MGAEMVEESARFPPEFGCVATARHFVRRVLADWGLDGIGENASLLVTELATNSVLHARTEFRVTVVLDGESLRLGVSDGSHRAPTTKSHSRQATTGRGMSLIVAVADSWGVEHRSDGKTVWCVLARQRPSELVDAAIRDNATGRVLEDPRPLPGRDRKAVAPTGRRRPAHHTTAVWQPA